MKKEDSLEFSLGPMTVSQEVHNGSDYIIELQIPNTYNQTQLQLDLKTFLASKYPGVKILP